MKNEHKRQYIAGVLASIGHAAAGMHNFETDVVYELTYTVKWTGSSLNMLETSKLKEVKDYDKAQET